MNEAQTHADRKHLVGILQRIAERKRQQARTVRQADNTAEGERAAGRADRDAMAVEWALSKLEQQAAEIEERSNA